MHSKLTNYKVLFRFILSNIFIFFIPLSICAFSYIHIIKDMNQDILDVTEKQQIESEMLVEERVQNLYRMSFQLSEDYDVSTFLGKDGLNPIELYNTNKISALINNYVNLNSTIESCFIYFEKSNTVVTREAVYPYQLFYGLFFKYGNSEAEEWKANYLVKYTVGDFLPLSEMMIEGRKQMGTLYMKSIGLPNGEKGILVIVMKNSTVSNILGSLSSKYGGWSYIQEKNGNIIASNYQGDAIQGKISDGLADKQGIGTFKKQGRKYWFVSHTSTLNGWKYVNVLDSDKLFDKSGKTVQFIIWVVAIVIGAGLFTAITFAFRNALPIIKLFIRVRGQEPVLSDGKKNVYEMIEGGFTRLSTQNEELKTILEEQKNLLRDLFYRKLVFGEFESIEGAKSEGLRNSIVLPEGLYSIAIIRILYKNQMDSGETMDEFGKVRNMIKISITNLLTVGEFVLEKNFDSLIVMFHMGSDQEVEIGVQSRTLEAKLVKDLYDKTDYGLMMGIGNAYKSVMEISRSYNEAIETLAYQSFTMKENLVAYNEIPKDQNVFYYPSEMETDLMRYVKSGNIDVVNSILDKIYSENNIERTLSSNMFKQLINELCGTAIRLTEQMTAANYKNVQQIRKGILEIYKEMNNIGIYNKIVQIFKDLCFEVEHKKKSHNSELMEDIIKYINNNYKDSNICLTQVAEIFQMNDSYLSNFFKEQKGESFSDHIESLRIEYACRLLAEQDYTIEDVAIKVGYTNQHTFRRALKRVKGVTPSEFRSSVYK